MTPVNSKNNTVPEMFSHLPSSGFRQTRAITFDEGLPIQPYKPHDVETSRGSQSKLVGGFNPFPKNAGQIASFFQGSGVKHEKCLSWKPPTRKQSV